MSSRHYLIAKDECVHLQYKSDSKVSSKDYLIAGDKRVRLIFGSWFIIPPNKEQKLRKKVSLKSSISSRDGPVKRTETRQV